MRKMNFRKGEGPHARTFCWMYCERQKKNNSNLITRFYIT